MVSLLGLYVLYHLHATTQGMASASDHRIIDGVGSEVDRRNEDYRVESFPLKLSDADLQNRMNAIAALGCFAHTKLTPTLDAHGIPIADRVLFICKNK